MELVAHAGNSTKAIPDDLIFKILFLLPVKSIIRLQSMSKQWFSIIRSKYLVDTFLSRSKTRPHLLLAFEHFAPRKPSLFFSVPEHKINDKTSTALSHDMSHSIDCYNCFSCPPVNGFICFMDLACSSYSTTVCNPITRQIVKLPNIGNHGRKLDQLLGYDPVEDEYKVLCVVKLYTDQRDKRKEHYVCTVSSSQKQEWRRIENTAVRNYHHSSQGICINGAIYYVVGESNIVRFNVRSETLELIKASKESDMPTSDATLVNYNGRLGCVELAYYKDEIRLRILEDAEKQEWSSVTFKYPCEWKELKFELHNSGGLIHTGELMLFRPSLKEAEPFCVYYYDFNKESARKVEIQGIMGTDDKHGTVVCYPGFVENIRFL